MAADREILRAAIQASISYGTAPGQNRWTLHPSTALSDPAVLAAAGRLLAPLVIAQRPDLIVTIGTAGLILATGLSAATGLPLAVVRKEPRHGRLVDGTRQNGRAVMVDDIVNSGTTAMARLTDGLAGIYPLPGEAGTYALRAKGQITGRRAIEVLHCAALVDLAPDRLRPIAASALFTRADFRTNPA